MKANQRETEITRLLEEAGIDTRKELAAETADRLHVKLLRINARLHLRDTPLLERRVAAWINAARRESLFY